MLSVLHTGRERFPLTEKERRKDFATDSEHTWSKWTAHTPKIYEPQPRPHTLHEI